MQTVPTIIQSALKNLGVEELNKMQETTLKQAVEGNDIILLSPTGSGKTIAYLLPLLLMLHNNSNDAQALILLPSRELALQTNAVFTAMKTGWKSCCCYGGHSFSDEKKYIIENHPAVIIGTPGRMTDHLSKNYINLHTIHTLVIDEFDKSLELGFHDSIATIVNELSCLKKRVLLSATDSEEIPHFVGMNKTVRLNFLNKSSLNAEKKLSLKKVLSPTKDKIETLYRLLCVLGERSCIVFCNYRDAVERVYNYLLHKKFPVERFHGGMEQNDRERSLYKFSNKSSNVLIATDLAARGLDIPEISYVIHYHLPINEYAFVHRNGRTTRWNSSGESYILLSEEEKLPEYIPQNIDAIILPDLTPPPPHPYWATIYIGRGKKDKLSRADIAGFLYKKGNLSKEDVGIINIKEHHSYVAVCCTKIKQLLNLVQGEKIKGMNTIIEKAR